MIIELKRDYKKQPYNGRLRLDWEIFPCLLLWIYTSEEKSLIFHLNIALKGAFPFIVLDISALGFSFNFVFTMKVRLRARAQS